MTMSPRDGRKTLDNSVTYWALARTRRRRVEGSASVDTAVAACSGIRCWNKFHDTATIAGITGAVHARKIPPEALSKRQTRKRADWTIPNACSPRPPRRPQSDQDGVLQREDGPRTTATTKNTRPPIDGARKLCSNPRER